MCDRAEVLALGCAAARAFPLYSRKTDGAGSSKTEPRVVSIGFVLTKVGGAAGGDPAPLTEEDIACLTAVSEGVRMAAEIVDAPTNEMHTDTFLDVRIIMYVPCIFTCACVCTTCSTLYAFEWERKGDVPSLNFDISLYLPENPLGGV